MFKAYVQGFLFPSDLRMGKPFTIIAIRQIPDILEIDWTDNADIKVTLKMLKMREV